MSPTDWPQRKLSLGTRLGVLGATAAIALVLFAWDIDIRRERSCVLDDTPYMPFCAASERPGVDALRERLRANPGETRSWVDLAWLMQDEMPPAALAGLTRVAPQEPNVLMLNAAAAARQQQLGVAAGFLVEAAASYRSREATAALARILASEPHRQLLMVHLDSAEAWLPPALAQMRAQRLPSASAFPVVLAAAERGTLPAGPVMAYIATLKSEGEWNSAQALWVGLRKQPTPILYNGAFELPLQPQGFDWDLPARGPRNGAAARLRNHTGHGRVLEIHFNGRPFATPIIRQLLFLAPGRHVVKGKYMATKLRSESGLAWSATCINKAAGLAGRSAPLVDTGGAWKEFRLEIEVPPHCGRVAALELGPAAAYEAVAGMKGQAYFDDLELQGP